MDKWFYVKDVKKDEAESFCESCMEQSPHLIYAFATARSNNPGMLAVYYKEKQPK